MGCKRGYTGDDCSQPLAPVVRRNILSLTEAEQDRFIEIIEMTKSVKDQDALYQSVNQLPLYHMIHLLRFLSMISLQHFIITLSEMSL